MDAKPFRCIYDPELSRSKSQGVKPIFTRSRGDQSSSDPRVGRARSVGRRTVPTSLLPLPDFARKNAKPVPRRCVITGVGPLVSRSKLYDVVRGFGAVEDCQIVMSQTTGASLGIAWVVFEQGEAHAARTLVEFSQHGQLSIDNQGSGLEVKLDASGNLLKQAERDAEEETRLQFRDTRSSHVNGAGSGHDESSDPYKDDVQMVELRSLTPVQVSRWYEKYLGLEPTYVMIRDIFLSVKRYSSDDIARAFKAFPLSHIAINRSGFYICFKNSNDAIDCYLKMHRRAIFGTPIKLLITLEGKRYNQEEVLALQKHNAETARTSAGPGYEPNHLEPNRGSSLRSATKTLRPGQQAHIIDEAADRILGSLSAHIKKSAWSNVLSGFVTSIIERELKKKQELVSENRDALSDSESPPQTQNDDSKESTPAAAHQNAAEHVVGFGARRSLGMTSRVLPKYGVVNSRSQFQGLKIRKRFTESSSVDAPHMKRRKQLHVTASAPNSYIRAPIEQAAKPATREKKTHDEAVPDIVHDITEDEDSSMDVEEDIQSEDEESMEESDDETRGMSIPGDILHPHQEPAIEIGYQAVQKQVRSKDDYLILKRLLNAQKGLDPALEEEIINEYFDEVQPKLRLDPVNWPLSPHNVPFRVSPYRNRPDDERREYLPNLGPGVPNEIVQNYKERPLYEGYEEIEEEESRTDSRALNVSRSAFGVNSDLFADDNLSKNAKDTRLARSAIHDWGLYANQTIPANDFVIEYVGDILRDEYAEVRERHYALEGIDSTYLFRLDNGTVIDATKRGNGARFINHSCDPNCTAQVFDYEGFKRVVLFSLRDIEPDEELTFDYNFVKSQDEDGKVRCACGAANCRGWLM